MTARLFTLVAAISLTSGCVVYTDDDDHHHVVVEEIPNYAPDIYFAEAGCYWDDYEGDFIWWFQSEVYDDNGRGDIAGVWADVYDVYGNYYESFELYNELPDPDLYFSDWLERSTMLDCYYGGYEIDIIAYDHYEAYDAVTVIPGTY